MDRLDWISTDIAEEQQVLGHGLWCSSVGTCRQQGKQGTPAHPGQVSDLCPMEAEEKLMPSQHLEAVFLRKAAGSAIQVLL